MTTRGDLDRINQAATFDPQLETPPGEARDGARPCLTVAGVQVYAYVEHLDQGPTLVVSVDYDTAGHGTATGGAEPFNDGHVLGWGDGAIPTEVHIGPTLRIALDAQGGRAVLTLLEGFGLSRN